MNSKQLKTLMMYEQYLKDKKELEEKGYGLSFRRFMGNKRMPHATAYSQILALVLAGYIRRDRKGLTIKGQEAVKNAI